LGWTEDLDVVQQPFVTELSYHFGRVVGVEYTFSVKECATLSAKQLCQTFNFTFTYSMLGTKICSVAGSCDALKSWIL